MSHHQIQFTNLPSRASVLNKMTQVWHPHRITENIPLEEVYGRIVAKTLHSQNTLPVVRASTADGIAVDASRFQNGIPDTSAWQLGKDYVRADTGDDFDDQFNAVIAIEEVTFTQAGGFTLSEKITALAAGDKVRGSGDTITCDDLVIQAHTRINAVDMSLLAMGGYKTVPVIKKPVVSFIPTGSELISAGELVRRGKNVDVNSLLAWHMLSDMGAQVLCYPIIKDKVNELESALLDALGKSDIVIINGGSSKGAEDFNASLLKKHGQVLCHGVAAAPGKPLCMAIVQGKLVINLPGPFVAAFWGLDWCARKAVSHYLNTPTEQRPTVKAVLTEEIKTPAHMEILCRVHLRQNAQGDYEATPLSFADRTLMYSANGIFVSLLGDALYPKGSTIDVELMRGLEYIDHIKEHE